MKYHVQKLIMLAVITGACLQTEVLAQGLTMEEYQKQQKAAADARATDPMWKPATVEVGKLQIGDKRTPGSLKNFCLNAEGNILACYNTPTGAAKGGSLKMFSPKGELLKTWPLEIGPEAVAVAKDGTIFAAGDGKLVKLDATGKVLATVVSPVASVPVVITKEMEEMIKQSGRSGPSEIENMKRALEQRRTSVTGLTVTDKDVFMAVPTPNEFTFQVYRFDHALQNPKVVVEKLRGCCGQMDIQSHNGNLWIPHNARHAVEARDRDGKQITKFGSAGKVKADDFGGCCEPKNLRVLANGEVLVAESGPPTCIKRFSAAGKFIEVVALVDGPSECVRVTVAVSPDGGRFYMLDTHNDAIRIFGPKTQGE
ncbi:MAG: hypothetical protein ACO1QS_04655 [Verrucomicrobiota bacterium]